MAPEILRELPYNEKCDVFSYAVVLWELYTRNIPWHKVGAFRVANDVAYQGQRHVPARLAWPLPALLTVPCVSVCVCVYVCVVRMWNRLPLPDDCPRKLAALIEFCWDANPDVRSTAPQHDTHTTHAQHARALNSMRVCFFAARATGGLAQVRPSFVEIVQTIEELDEEVWLRKGAAQ